MTTGPGSRIVAWRPQDMAPAAGAGEVSLERVTALAREALAGSPPSEAEAFVMRLRRHWTDLWEGLIDPYGRDPRLAENLERLIRVLAGRWADRPAILRRVGGFGGGLAPGLSQPAKPLSDPVSGLDRLAGFDGNG